MSDLSTVEALPLRQVQNVRQLLVNKEAETRLASIATKQLGADKLVKLTIEALRRTPKIGDCDPMSVFNAMIQCATLGLEPNTVQQHAFLIPYGKECTFVIGYKGMADLARRHPSVVSIHSDVVYSDDDLWTYEYGSGVHLRHKPGPRLGKPTHAYCYVKLRDGEAFTVLPWAQVLKTRDQSQGWQSAVKYGKTAKSPWHTHTDRMAAKTALRALANAGEMPMANEFLAAIRADERAGANTLPEPGYNPLDDMTIEGDFDEVTGEVRPDPEPERKVAPPAERKTAAKPKPEEKTQAGQKPNTKADAEDWTAFYEMLVAGWMDGADPAVDLEDRSETLDRMKAADPALHGRLMEEADAFLLNGEDTGGSEEE